MFKKTDMEDTVLAEIQGKVFEKSCTLGLDSEIFVNSFMRSETASNLDLPHHKIRWAGEMYVLYDFLDTHKVPEGKVWNSEAMFWIGFAYRFWHSLTDQKSKDIVKIADGSAMLGLYPRLHTDNVESSVAAILDGRARPDIRAK